MIALYKCLLFIVSGPIILSPYTLNSFVYFIFLVLDTVGKSQNTDRIVVEHFPCHSKNTLLKNHKNKKKHSLARTFKYQVERDRWNTAIAQGCEKTWCWDKDSPILFTPVVPVFTLGYSNRGRGQGADCVGPSNELQWLTTSLQL